VCGIAGIAGRLDDRDALVRVMTRRLAHRGPDDEGFWSSESCALGHRRLSILDLSPNGHQPMANEDGTVLVTFNGEIYNFAELRAQLETAGHRFRSRTDTEVLVHLYEERGEDFVVALRGMFALALWDERRRRLLLARDHFGQKPLFWARLGKAILFASEIKALLACPALSREADPDAIDTFLTLQFIPAPLTGYRSIRRLSAATVLAFEGDGEVRLHRYWNPSDGEPRLITLGEAAEEVDSQLRRVMREQLVSDVPVGVLLSGGIDSSLVLAAASDEGAKGIDAFSIGFEETAYDEVPHARHVAAAVGAKHHVQTVRADDLVEPSKILDTFDEPFADVAALPTMVLSSLARERVKVALTGDGGDELFGGYQHHLVAHWMARLAFGAKPRAAMARHALRLLPPGIRFRSTWRLIRRSLEALGQPDWRTATTAMRSTLDHSAREKLYSPDFYAEVARSDPYPFVSASPLGDLDPARLFRVAGDYVLADQLLMKSDLSSMTVGLECRSPFLDVPLAEFAASLPIDLKVRGFHGKHLLRFLAARRFGREVSRRKKQGFTMPVDRWLRDALRPLAEDLLFSPNARLQAYVRATTLASLWRAHQEERADHRRILWACLMLELWLRR